MSGARPAKRQTPAQILLRKHLLELKQFKAVEIQGEYRFWDERKWRFDLAIPHLRLAFEANGGKWSGGHRRGKGRRWHPVSCA